MVQSGLYVTATGTTMAGLGLFDQKSALTVTVTIPIVTAFKGHRKNGLLGRFNRQKLRFGVFD